jgi:predicted ATPase/transcriptional regulator with XRE-family HTH domain
MDATLSFGSWLKRRRRALGLTQAELARRVGYVEVTIRKIEADELRPSFQAAENLAKVLVIAPEERQAFICIARDEAHPEDMPTPVMMADLRQEANALQRPNNLLAPVTSLVGREQEVRRVSTLLAHESVRLLTLTGPGGVGKTRLAIQAAHDLLDHFEDGICFVSLAPISAPDLIASTIVQALGMRETSSRSLLDRLKDFLCDKHLLLLLDNFEHVIASGPLVAELLAAAPGVKVLVTSRAVLRLSGEHEFPVAPLEVPDLKRLPPIGVLAQYAAVELFVQRARAVTPSFQFTPANAASVAELCVRLDGLPLAIELAAARVKLLPPHMLLARLDYCLPILTGGSRDLPARQQTLRATIDWSYDLLTGAEQQMFRRLAVFVGGCTLEAVEAVLIDQHEATNDVDRTRAFQPAALDILDGLTALMDKSLIQQSDTDGEPRFTMLETIREYALERLAESGEADAVQRRHT